MSSSSNVSAAKANLLGKREPEDDLETKPVLKKHKEQSEEKEVALRKKTLFVDNLSSRTKIHHIIDFFKDVGQVFRVRLMLNLNEKYYNLAGCFVEFASSNEAKKALEKKKGGILLGKEIILQMAKIDPYNPQHKYCLEHNVWHEDYLQQESHAIEEDDPVEERNVPADFSEAVLFVANLSPQTKILHINDFFDNVGEVVSVRLIVNHEGKHVGYGFVEFSSPNEAKKALEEMNGEYLHDHKIFLQVVKIAPYPPQHKYNLAERLCYEDYFRRESLLIEDDKLVEGCVKPSNFVEAVAVRKKTLCFLRLSPHIKLPHIISFFKDVGEVVSVRLTVNHKGNHVGFVFVEFASSDEAEKAMEKKNGEILRGHKVLLQGAKIAPHPPPKYCFDHKVWFEDYHRRESLTIGEDELVEGLDEPPDFVEEVAARKKTLFIANLAPQTTIWHINKMFNNVSNIVSVRLIVNDENKHVGCGYVEFASANEAKKVLQKKNCEVLQGHRTFLQVAKIAPYPPRPRYSHAEMVWYEDYLRRESLIEEKPEEKVPKLGVFSIFSGKKITFSDDD